MKDKKSIRPILDATLLLGDLSTIEHFQNATLRPIIKMQHDLIITLTKYYIISKKNVFSNLETLQKENYITDQIVGDKNIRQELNDIIVGMMTVEEITFYNTHRSELKKRIRTIILQRLLSNISALN